LGGEMRLGDEKRGKRGGERGRKGRERVQGGARGIYWARGRIPPGMYHPLYRVSYERSNCALAGGYR
jgi:hypothetical protein